jgi:N-acyl-D-aspartate/D-glutamate deacylase
MMLDLKIVGGTIVDGSGAPRYQGDVGIKNGKIVSLGKVADRARQSIDAVGKIVSPGFVDVHTHYDAQVFWDPTLSPSCYHGITTVFGGHCGFGIAPLSQESGAYLQPMLARVEGMPLESLQKGAKWNWTSFAEYLSRFEGTLAINAGFLAGHSTIRRYVMGPEACKREATSAELAQMKEVLRQAIRDGAMGFSSSLSVTHNDADGIPVPSRHASREEVMQMYSVVSEFEGTVAEIAPPSVDFNTDTYAVLTDVSLAARRPVNWNVVGVWQGTPEELEGLELRLGASDYARERGAEVIALTMPKTPTTRLNLVSGFVFDAFDGWAPLFRLTIPERMVKLRDPLYRASLKQKAEAQQGVLKVLAQWGKIIVAEAFAPQNKHYQGRLIGDIAAEEGRDPFDVLLDIALADELKTSLMPKLPEDTLELYRARAKLLANSRTVLGASDAGAHLDMTDTFGFAMSLLETGVRKFQVISLEQAVHHLTQRPAQLVGLKERGVLKLGWHADVVVFDAAEVGASPLYTRTDLPANGARLYADAKGIHHVIVNGREIIRDSEYLGVPAGTVFRPGRDTYTVPIAANGGRK